MTDLFQPLYLPSAEKGPELNPSFQEVMSSAFNLENDVVNLLDYISKPVFPPDDAFDFLSTFNERKLPLDYMPLLSASTSQAEFDFTLGKVQKELQDKQVLAAGGWGGTVAALGAGILSPTAFIPFAGQARGAKGFAQILSLAAAGATAQNGALFLNQETRTEAELYSGVAMDTLLMGMLGGAWLGLSGRARSKLIEDVQFNQKRAEVPTGALDVPSGNSTVVRTEKATAADVKREALELGIRDPEQVQELLDEADLDGTYIPFKDRALTVGPVTRAQAKTPEDQLAYGKSYLTTQVAQGVTARFSKVPAGSGGKWFQDNEYAITLHAEDGAEISIPQSSVDSFQKAGSTQIYKEAELKQALAEGKLDDQLYTMLETADDPRAREALGDKGMALSPNEATIRTSTSADARSVGAAVPRSRNTLGAKAAPSRLRQAALDTLGRVSPSYRMLTQKFFPSLRHGIAKLDMSGLQQAGLDLVEPSASGGTVIERIRGYGKYIDEFTSALDKNFYKYIHGTDKGFDFNSTAVTQLKSMLGRMPKGKLNYSQYKAAVFDALNTGEISPDFADSVAALKKFYENYTARQTQYLEEFARNGLDVKPLFKELTKENLGPGIEEYAHHIIDKQALMKNFNEFLDDVAKHNEKSLTEAFAKARLRYAKRKGALEFEKHVSELTPEMISSRLAQVESDLEFLEELPEWQEFRSQRLELLKQSRDENWTKEALKEAQKNLTENMTPEVKKLQDDRKELMKAAKAYRKFGGDAAEKTAKLKLEIDKVDELISSMFRTELPKIEKVDLQIGLVQKQSDAELKKVNVALQRMVKTIGARQANMHKLLQSKRNNTVSRAKVAELLEAAKAKYDDLLLRLKMVEGKNVAFDQQLSELQLIREEVISDATRLVKARSAKAADLEDRLEEAAVKVLTPEERARMKAQIEHELTTLDGDFQQTWSARGERSGDPTETDAPDFREKAREMATMLHQKLMNTEVELSPAYHALRQDARGAELLRTWNLPYSIKQKWLIKDVELNVRAYDRVMGPDLELWRAFDGSANAKSLLGDMQVEATEHLNRISTAKYVKLPKGWTDKAAAFSARVKKSLTDLGEFDDVYLGPQSFSDTPKAGFVEISTELRNQLAQSINDAVKASTRDVDVAIQRLRHTRTVPQDSGSIMWRTGKAIKSANVFTMLGGVVTASVSDLARPIVRYGIGKTLGRGWRPFINQLSAETRAFRVRSKQVNRQIGLNLEPVMHGRSQALFDLADDSIGRTKLERGISFLSEKTGLFAMYDYWTAGMKTIAGNIVHATMTSYIPLVAKAWREGIEPTADVLQMRTYLRNKGLSDLDIHRIALQLERPGGIENFSNGGILPNVDNWDDPAAYQAYQAAVLKEVNDLIVTPGLERPNWTDENLAYSMLAQFKSFTFSSTSKMAMSGLQGNDPYLMQGIAFSLAFGALSYYTYAISVGGKTLEKAKEMDAEDWLWQAVKRSGYLGVLSIASDAADAVPMVNGEQPSMFTKPGGLLGTLLGPTYSQAEKMATVVMQINSDDPKQQARNLRSIRQVFIPFQNHFLFRQFFDRVGDAMIGE